MQKLKVAVLISGEGTNLQALIDTCFNPNFPAEIVAVISNNASAFGLKRAQQFAIPQHILDHKDYDSREAFDAALHELIVSTGAQFICLAGYMRLLSKEFVDKWPLKIINIHPSLLPAFKGIDAHEQVLKAGVRFTGCTVHFVIPEMDAGPIILQAAVPVYPGDTPGSLKKRVQLVEHECYPIALHLIAENKVRVEDGIVAIDGFVEPDGAIINPANDLTAKDIDRLHHVH